MTKPKTDLVQFEAKLDSIETQLTTRQGQERAVADMTTAVGALASAVANQSEKFDDFSIHATTEKTPDGGAKSTFTLRAYKR